MLRGTVCPFIPTDATCDEGQASILQMDSVYQSLDPSLQAQYRSSHDAIMASYADTWYAGIDLIPFNPACSTICNLGVQAEGLTAQMQSLAGQVPVGVGPSGQQPSLLPSLLGGSQTTILLIGGLVMLYLFLNPRIVRV